jgi:hypothetical protein
MMTTIENLLSPLEAASVLELTTAGPSRFDERGAALHMLLGFVYFENITYGHDTDSETACLWRGPLDVLLNS